MWLIKSTNIPPKWIFKWFLRSVKSLGVKIKENKSL